MIHDLQWHHGHFKLLPSLTWMLQRKNCVPSCNSKNLSWIISWWQSSSSQALSRRYNQQGCRIIALWTVLLMLAGGAAYASYTAQQVESTSRQEESAEEELMMAIQEESLPPMDDNVVLPGTGNYSVLDTQESIWVLGHRDDGPLSVSFPSTNSIPSRHGDGPLTSLSCFYAEEGPGILSSLQRDSTVEEVMVALGEQTTYYPDDGSGNMTVLNFGDAVIPTAVHESRDSLTESGGCLRPSYHLSSRRGSS